MQLQMRLPDELAAQSEGSRFELPTFSFVPYVNRRAPDDVQADLVLLTKLYQHDIPLSMLPRDPQVAEYLRTTIANEFPGKRGTKKLLQVDLPNSRGETGRHLLLVGLGKPISYTGHIVCDVFNTLFAEAIELGAETVVVPFVPNATTKVVLSHKSTAYKLKSVLKQIAAKNGSVGRVREVKILCAHQAVNTIQEALRIDHGDHCGCKRSRSKRT